MGHLSDQGIGARVKAFREQVGHTQAQLGAVLGLDQTAISRIEAGTRALSARELVAVSEHFGVPASSFATDESPTPVLRDSEADSEAVKAGIAAFNRYIDGYFGVKALNDAGA